MPTRSGRCLIDQCGEVTSHNLSFVLSSVDVHVLDFVLVQLWFYQQWMPLCDFYKVAYKIVIYI